MKFRLHVIAGVLFALCFLYDVVVWGSVYALPDVGTRIADSARREAPLATTYIAVGNMVDSMSPALHGLRQRTSRGCFQRRLRAHPRRSDGRHGPSFRPKLERDAQLDQDDVLGRAGAAADRSGSLGAAAEKGPRAAGADRTSGRLNLFTCGSPNAGQGHLSGQVFHVCNCPDIFFASHKIINSFK